MRGGRWGRHSGRAGVAVLLGGLIAGCIARSPDPRLFTLGAEPRATTAVLDSEIAVLVGPARFPRHLERPQVTRRRVGGEIEIDEFNRWAGGFDVNVLRALAEDLAARLASDRVVAYPSKAPFPFDYRLRLHFDELVVGPDATLRLRARWALLGAGSAQAPAIGRTDLDVPLGGEGMLPIVAAHDAAIRALGQAIAERISGLEEAGRTASAPALEADVVEE